MSFYPKYLDTHSHVNHPMFSEDWHSVVSRALSEGIWMIVVGSDLESTARAIEIAEQFPYGVYAAAGSHSAYGETRSMDMFQQWAHHPKVVAIGEVNADEDFLNLAAEVHLPLILSVRGSHDEAARSLRDLSKQVPGARVSGVIHHFTGSRSEFDRYKKLGFMPSFTNVLVRARSESMQRIPIQHALVESECPHIVPMHIASGRPDPNYLPHTMHQVAAQYAKSPEVWGHEVTRNALSLFPKILRTLPV